MQFPTSYEQIQERVAHFNPMPYAATRNYIDGSVSYLSPYISRGVITVADVQREVMKKYPAKTIYKFLQELAWREYWQRTWQAKQDAILHDLKYPQQDVVHHQMVTAIDEASTGIHAIDSHINLLYEHGYMHNHMRMYVAAISCNIAKAQWLQPAKWMYYHLLDGDVASNHLSWQWVAGSLSRKKYYCNQDNINRYTRSRQQESYLDLPYEQLVKMPVPAELNGTYPLRLETKLPPTDLPEINSSKPVLLYNSYNIDPHWRSSEDCNRVLMLEPSHFEQFPVSEKSIGFIRSLSVNIPGIQIFTGEISALEQAFPSARFISKEHPAFSHYPGEKDERQWMFPEVKGYFPSFFAFWKQCEKFLNS